MAGALLTKTGGMGLMGAAQLKKLASKASTAAAAERQIDEKQWKENVCDLPQVMAVAQNIYLALEHNNEALIRVAVEIVTCRQARKCLWWDSMWYGDDYKREHFKEIVAEKFKIALASAGGNTTKLTDILPTQKESGDPKAMAELQQKLKDAEAAAKAAQQQQKMAELRCRELDEGAGDAQSRIKDLEKSLEAMRQAAREKTEDTSPNTSAADAAKLAELEKKLKAAEQEKSMMNQKLSDVEKKLKTAVDEKGAAEAEAASAKSAAADAAKAASAAAARENKKGAAGGEALSPTSAAAAQRAAAAPTKTGKDPNPELEAKVEAMQNEVKEAAGKLNAEKQRTAAVTSERDAALEEVERLRRELQQANDRATHAEQNPQTVVVHEEKAPVAQAQHQQQQQVRRETPSRDTSPTHADAADPARKAGMTKEQKAEMEELRKKAEIADKMTEKIKMQREELSTLREEKEAWEAERMKMLKMLHTMKEQLKKVSEIAEKKGLKGVMDEVFEESGVMATLNDPEYTCFNRLYDDAVRRQKKMNEIQSQRLANSGLQAPVGQLRRSSIGGELPGGPPMNATWGGSNHMSMSSAPNPYQGRRGSTGSPTFAQHGQHGMTWNQPQAYNPQGNSQPSSGPNSRPNSRNGGNYQPIEYRGGEKYMYNEDGLEFVSTGRFRMDVPNVAGFNGADTLSSTTTTRRGFGSILDTGPTIGVESQFAPSSFQGASWNPRMSLASSARHEVALAPFADGTIGSPDGNLGTVPQHRQLSPPRTAGFRDGGFSATRTGVLGGERRSPSPMSGSGLPPPERSGRLRPLLLAHSQSEPVTNFRATGVESLSPIKSSAGSSPLGTSPLTVNTGSPLGGGDLIALTPHKPGFLQGIQGPVSKHQGMRGHLLVVRPGTHHSRRAELNGADPFFGSKALQGHGLQTRTAHPSPLFAGDGHPDFSPAHPTGERILVEDIPPKGRKISRVDGLEDLLSETLEAA